MADPAQSSAERRHTPRFACGGRARIASLPLEGSVVLGKLLDLSLGGCCIETPQPLHPGAEAEVLIQVNDRSFRALGQLKAIRGRLAGMQFRYLTEAGNQDLRNVLAEVAKLHAAVSALRSARRRQDGKLLLGSQEDELPGVSLTKQFPVLRTILASPPSTRHIIEVESDRAGLDPSLVETGLVFIDLFV